MNYFTRRKLKKCNPDNIDFFSLKGQKLYTRMIDAYDGDTCTLILPIYKDLKKLKCRLHRIDTPELRTSDPLEKQYAIKARDRLLEFKDKILIAYISEADKYGRYLVDLYTEHGECINDLLVYEGLAYEYYGGTKQKFHDWVKDLEHMQHTPMEIARTFHKPDKRAGLFSCFRCHY
jgi:endonuclease YncB( thermonuclease family)